ncbi:MAG: CoA transferase [Alphaproteobacteria bacterium]|nr:CoA transferase [Alphaproteobacteria bacterium]
MTADHSAYAGLRVCDLTQGVAGPHCAFLLAQHGADVIKIEPPGGDWGRGIGKRHGPYSAFFLQVNRGKRSLALDLKQAEARDAAAKVAAEADVVLEAFRPGVTARFGLDYENVRAVNPDVIYLSVTGYGQTGPWSNRPLTDSIAQAVTGMMSMNRDKDGLPQRIGMIAIDVMTGLYAFQAVSAALYARTVRGAPGRYIDMSLQQSAGAFMAAKMIEYHLEGPVPQVVGVPVGTFESADGFVNINARREKHFEALCGLVDRPELAADLRFASYEARIENEAALMAQLRPLVRERSTAEWVRLLGEADIIAGPVNDFGDYFQEPQVLHNSSVAWQEHDAVGRVPMHAVPGIETAPEGSFLATAPDLGAHSRAVLSEYGYSDRDIDGMAASGAVIDGARTDRARRAAQAAAD